MLKQPQGTLTFAKGQGLAGELMNMPLLLLDKVVDNNPGAVAGNYEAFIGGERLNARQLKERLHAYYIAGHEEMVQQIITVPWLWDQDRAMDDALRYMTAMVEEAFATREDAEATTGGNSAKWYAAAIAAAAAITTAAIGANAAAQDRRDRERARQEAARLERERLAAYQKGEWYKGERLKMILIGGGALLAVLLIALFLVKRKKKA